MIKPIGKWKQIFEPDKLCRYINDHTIFEDQNNSFHLLGTSSKKNYAIFRERSFLHAVAEKFAGLYKEERLIFQSIPHRGIKISPYVYFDKGHQEYHLFFGPGKISHCVSADGRDWQYKNIAIKTAWPFTRDPAIIKYKNKYLMYLTGSRNRVVVYESNNLDDWEYVGAALKLGRSAPTSINSASESPTVIEYHGQFYLFTTIVPGILGTRKNYNKTLIFRSSDPLDFGIYQGKNKPTPNLVGELEAHAPEVFVRDDRIFYTTCGWTGFPSPEGVTSDGVWLRELKID